MGIIVRRSKRRILRILLCGLLLTCPACRYGHMFRSLWRMNLRCPICGIIFERDVGEVTGGMWINASITSLLIVIPAFYFGMFTQIPVWPLIGMLAAFTIGLGLLLYRPARGLWVSILYLTGSIDEH